MIKTYKILLDGECYHFKNQKKNDFVGFYITVLIDAETPEEAKKIALNNIMSDSRLAGIEAVHPDISKISVDEITLSHASDRPQLGCSYYIMDCKPC